MKSKTIEEEWQGFSTRIFAKMNPSPIQRQEMKRAFFAGAWAILCSLNQIAQPEISEDDFDRFLEDRLREGEAFYRELIKRYAEGN